MTFHREYKSPTRRTRTWGVWIAVVGWLGLFVGVTNAAPFTHSNGYFSVAGDDGMITDLRLDATGAGSYGANTIAVGGHLSFLIDGTLLTDAGAGVGIVGDVMTITGLPSGATLTITLSGDTMTARITFSGSHTIRHEWDLVYVDAGFYQRANGTNYGPDRTVNMPFESFYNTVNGNYRPLEMFKRTAGAPGPGDGRDVSWPTMHCRARVANDVRVTATHNMEAFDPQANELTLVHEGAALSCSARRFSWGSSASSRPRAVCSCNPAFRPATALRRSARATSPTTARCSILRRPPRR